MPADSDKTQAKAARLYGLDTVTDTFVAVRVDQSGNLITNPGSGSTLPTIEFLNTSATFGARSASAVITASVVAGTNQSGRRLLTILPFDGDVFYGFTSDVTTATGTPIFQQEKISLPYGSAITVFVVPSTGTVNLRITESR